MDLTERIALGTQFLDSVKPGWAGQINLEELDLSLPSSCVLGQLFAPDLDDSYEWPMSGFGRAGHILHDWLVDNGHFTDEEITSSQELAGFEKLGIYSEDWSDDTYEDLQVAWEQVIADRV